MKSGITDRKESSTTTFIPEGFKKTRYGLRPKDWKLYRVSEILYKVSNPVVVKPECTYREIGIRSHGKGIFYKEETTGKKLGNKAVFSIEPGCLILNIVFAWELAVAKTTEKEAGYIASHRFPMYKPIEGKINLDFITHFFTSQEGENILKLASPGGAGRNKTLSQKEFLDAEVVIPHDVNEQQEIAGILSTWDKAIALKEKLIEQKKALKVGLMQNLLTGKIRLNEDNKRSNTQRLKEFRKGGIPEGYRRVRWFIIPDDWSFRKINTVAEQVSVTNKENKGYKVLSCTKHDGLVDSLMYFGKRVFSEDITNYKVVEKNHFVYATNHIEEGSIGLQNLYDYGLVSPMYTVFKTKGDIDNDFLYVLLKSENYRKIFETMMSASVERRGSLRWKDFSEIRIPIPPINEQREIVKISLACDAEITLLQKQLESLKQQKKGLMQLLLTGKVRVKC